MTARFITEDDSEYSNEKDPLSLNLYTYCANNPIKHNDPTGHWTADVHVDKSKEWIEDEFNKYLQDECNKIYVYQVDKNGNIRKDKKGNPLVDSGATCQARSAFMKENKPKIAGYVDALVAGNKYVDSENTILKKVNFAADNVFHGVGGYDTEGFITDRKSTAATILTSKSYDKGTATEKYIVKSAVEFAYPQLSKDNNMKAQALIISQIEIYVEPSSYISGGKATKENAALFVLGMGLHTVQDEFAHGMYTYAHKTNVNDDPTWDYNYKEKKWKEGNERITNTEEATRNYISDFLDDYGSYLFMPYSAKSKK